MADQRTPILYSELEVNESLDGADIAPIEQPSSGGLRRQKKLTFTSLSEWLAGVLKFISGIVLTSGRIAMKELVSGALSVSGWYTIAETDVQNYTVHNVGISVLSRGASRIGTLDSEISFSQSTTAKTHLNNRIEITGLSIGAGNTGVKELRLAKSDSVINAGAKIQVYVDVSVDVTLTNQIRKNSTDKGIGFQLVPPYLDNTPTLPDGVTAGTFLEAGEELSLDNGILSNPYPIIAVKSGNDQIRCTIDWQEIPKQGTGLTITLPSTSLQFNDGAGTSTVLGSFTISNFVILGKRVSFFINQTGIATSLINSGLVMIANGTGGKFTIT